MNFLEKISSYGNLPKPFDITKAELHFKQLYRTIDQSASRENKKLFETFKKQEGFNCFLSAIFGNSPYLSKLTLNHINTLCLWLQQGPEKTFKQTLDELKTAKIEHESQEAILKEIRILKQKIALTIGLADIAGIWDVQTVTEKLSEFADKIISTCVDYLLHKAEKNGEISLNNKKHPTENSGLVLLALGKLGAMELNYSSDIDIIVFFEPEKLDYKGTKTLQQFYIALTRNLVTLLEERTQEGYVFRTDLRLRPDPTSTPVAISLTTAFNYYQTVGQNWERAAMIKARAITGDSESIEVFFQQINAYIWRKYLDFTTLQDIHSIKRQISSNIKNLPKDLKGHNIKTGHGGIREIEFFVQTQQLIWGGQTQSIRKNATLSALQELVEQGRVEQSVANDLSDTYSYLRKLEHRLQMVNDAQTHTLPKDESNFNAIAIFMGYENSDAFSTELHNHLTTVEKHYSELFHSAPELGYEGSLVFTGTDDDPDTLETLKKMGYKLPSSISQTIRSWHHGKYRATRNRRACALLTELMPKLLKSFSETPAPDQAFLKFDEFLSKLPASVQLFSLFTANPSLMKLIAELMGSYPYMADNLARKPYLLEYVLYPDFLMPLEKKADLRLELLQFIEKASDYEDILNYVRRWTHERHFRSGVQLIKGKVSPKEVRKVLSDIAEVVLEVLLTEVTNEFEEQHGKIKGGEFAVIGLGKLGSRNITFDSDIDVVFVYKASEYDKPSDGKKPLLPNEYYVRLSRRFMSAFSALTAEGRLYEIDIRLRPSGKDGPLCSSIKAFSDYYERNAWKIEYLILTKARPVVGNNALCIEIENVIHRHIKTGFNHHGLLQEIEKFRKKLKQQHSTHDIWNIKYTDGGLYDVEFIAQYLQLLHGKDHPAIIATDMNKAFEFIEKSKLLQANTAKELAAANSFFLDIQTCLRIAFSRKSEREAFSEGIKHFLIKAMEYESFDALKNQLKQHIAFVKNTYNEIMLQK